MSKPSRVSRRPGTVGLREVLFLGIGIGLFGCATAEPVDAPRFERDAGDIPPPPLPVYPICSGTPLTCESRSLSTCEHGGDCEETLGCEGTATIACETAGNSFDCDNRGCWWQGGRFTGYCADLTDSDCSRYDDYSSPQTRCGRRAGCTWGDVCRRTIYVRCEDASAENCSSMGCDLDCGADVDICGGQCVDMDTDPTHCGGCYSRCTDAGFGCVAGDCVCLAPNTEDRCGRCDSDPSNDCVQDCMGQWGGTAILDDCGVCDYSQINDCDCTGTPGGLAQEDDCGVCDEDPLNDCDCAGTPGGTAVEDDCGVCDEDPLNDCDCAGVPGGIGEVDGCGVCNADPADGCVQDCAGVWGGEALEDACGNCDTDPSNDCPGCGGAGALGSCWYLGAEDESCADVCATHGGFDDATVSVAGSAGTNGGCEAALTALGHPGTVTDRETTMAGVAHLGCVVETGGTGNYRYHGLNTWELAHNLGNRRACACVD